MSGGRVLRRGRVGRVQDDRRAPRALPPLPVEAGRVDRAPAAAWRAWTGRPALALLFLATAVLVLRLTPDRLRHAVPGNLGDPVLIAWLLDWAGHSAVTSPTHYFDAPIYAPATGTTAYTDSLLPLAAVFGPVHALVGSTHWATALDVTLVAVVVADLAATYALARWLTGRADAALVAAFAFTCGAFLVGHIPNPQLLAAGFLPAGFLLLFRVLVAPRLREAVALALVTVAQVLAAAYYGVLWGVCAVVVVLGWVLVRRRLDGAQVRALALAGVVTVVLLVPLVGPYLALQKDPAFARAPLPGGSFVWADLLTPVLGNPVWGWLTPTFGARNEHVAFPGLLVALLALAGAATALGRRRRVHEPGPGTPDDRRLALWLLVACGILSAVLSAGPVAAGHAAPFAFFQDHVPGFSGVRVPARMVVVAVLVVAVLAGAGWARLTARVAPGRRLLLTAVVLVVVVAEGGGPVPYATLPVDDTTLGVYRLLQSRGPGTVLELPLPDPTHSPDYPYVESPRQLYATLDRHPRVNGYSGYTRPGYEQDSVLLAGFPAPPTLARARELGVRFVVLHGGPGDSAYGLGPESRARVLAALPPSVAVTAVGADLLLELRD